MFQLMFRKPWLLVLWVAGILFSVSNFVGEGGGVDQIATSAEQIRAQRASLSQPPAPVVQAAEPDLAAPALPPLLPADDPHADPHNPEVGDVFLDPVSGHRVRIVERTQSAGYAQPTED